MISNILSRVAIGALVLTQASAQSTVPPFTYGTPSADYPGVKSQNANGPTNPDSPQLGTPINQTSLSRLVSVNSVDDWCLFGPDTSEVIANIEGETLAWCTQARNNARVIPDGTVTAAHFVKTPLYVQVMALGDFTKILVVPGDEGGELDPHGATNLGNPVGGNVTSNVSGQDVFYQEWMSYISYNEFCIRICIAGSDQAPTPTECQHTIDELGCEWVMPGDYTDGVFDTCEADAAYPPGLFPQADGSTSTFQQYYSSVYTDPSGGLHTFVNGSPNEATPSAAYSTPASSSCSTTNTIANKIASIVPTSSSSSVVTTTSIKKSASSTAGLSSHQGSGSSQNGSNSSGSGSGSSSSAMSLIPGVGFAVILTLVGAVAAL